MIRRFRLQTTLAASAAAVVLALGLLAGCFSEHEAATAVSGTCNVQLGEGLPGSTVVVIQDFAFGPQDVHVRAGERVTWINCDTDEHTSTGDAGEWASPLLAPGDAFTQTFPTVGEFPYHCEPHPFMLARVIVE